MRDMAYRHYVCDALRIVTENTAKAVNNGAYLNVRLAEILSPESDVDEMAADEIIAGIKNKIIKG